jgi:hypothetical protein
LAGHGVFYIYQLGHPFWQLFLQVRAKKYRAVFDFSQGFIAGMLRAIANMNFFN